MLVTDKSSNVNIIYAFEVYLYILLSDILQLCSFLSNEQLMLMFYSEVS